MTALNDLTGGHSSHDAQEWPASGEPFSAADHHGNDTQKVFVGGTPTSTPASLETQPTGCPLGSTLSKSVEVSQAQPVTHPAAADLDTSSPPASSATQPTRPPLGSTLSEPAVQRQYDTHMTSDGWLELRVWAEMFNDAQQQRIATTNRAERGGVDPDIYAPYTEALEIAEKAARRGMILAYRRTVPNEIQSWVKQSHGLGEPLMARILGHLGHPIWASPHHWEGTGAKRLLITDPPYERTVGQLWQYCGHGRPGRAQKGATAADLAALGSPTLKMLVHLASECCMKQKASPFRLVYEQARIDYRDKTHSVVCVRCGPSGKPAQPGSPWSLGHQYNAALRKVGKEILRDLWTAADAGRFQRKKDDGRSDACLVARHGLGTMT